MTYKNPFLKIMEDNLPEAKKIPHTSNYTYKEYHICLGCGFIKNKTTNEIYRFHSPDGFGKIINKIKANDDKPETF